MDCRATGDPASDKSLRDHLGTYPPNMRHTTTNQKWVDWWKEVVPSAHRLLTEQEEATCAGKCVECQWENPLTKPMAEEAVRLAQQLWKEVVLGAGDRLPEPGGSAAADREEKAARAEPASGSRHRPGDSLGSTERPTGDPSEGTQQSVDVGKQKSQDLECWDLRSSMKEMSDDQLKKVAFLFLSRIYSVFDPQKQGKVPELIAKV